MRESSRRKVMYVHRRLLKLYGEAAVPVRRGDALGELIACILSQHTSDLNSGRAYEALRARFPTWELVRDAPSRSVVDAIRSCGLANQKGPRIQAVLRAISPTCPTLDINFLADWPVPAAKAWLQALHGVGPKTAAITLLFGLGRPAFPVDTHVHRVAGRLGLIPNNKSKGGKKQSQTVNPAPQAAGQTLTADQAHDALEAIVPPRLFFPFHMNLIRHGRTICQARQPKCNLCPLTTVCDYYLG